MVHAFAPRGGPLGGNSSLSLTGLRLESLGDVRCRFGVLNAEVNATIDSDTHARCVSPPHWHQQPVSQSVELELTLNGQVPS